MSIQDDGGSAFPLVDHIDNDNNYKCAESGMSLRDYFAAKSMQGMVTAEFGNTFSPEHWAEYSYKVADAMLKERAK
jgi:hypothetical protein